MSFTTDMLRHRALALALLAASCGGEGGGTAAIPGPTPNNPAPANRGGGDNEGTSSDAATCQRACSMLVGCGVEYDAACAANCQRAPVFLACARAAGDCQALALCAFRQDSALTCGSETAGYPAGAEGCGTTALCEGMCAVANQPPSCRCACNARLAPSQALKLLINNQCALARCPVECGPAGNGPACVACFQSSCQPASAQCTSAAGSGLKR